MKSKCKMLTRGSWPVRIFATVILLTLASPVFGQEASARKPRIEKYPEAAVWSDAETAAKEFSGLEFVGEFVQDNQGMQVTPAADKFYSVIYTGGLPGEGWDGSETIRQWHDAEAIKSALKGWKRVDRSSSHTGKRPPENAIVLFDGSNTKEWKNGQAKNGFLKAGTRTRKTFQDFHLYFEFLIPLKPEPPISHPHRGNSGVFALGAYEVQIADTFGLDPAPEAWQDNVMLKPVNTWCGSIYGIRAPDTNMTLPPLRWQSMEIDFTAARFKDGKKVSPAVLSLIHNGVKVHDRIELPRGTGGGPSGPRKEVAKGPIVLQNHGNPNLFRNIWIVEKSSQAEGSETLNMRFENVQPEDPQPPGKTN